MITFMCMLFSFVEREREREQGRGGWREDVMEIGTILEIGSECKRGSGAGCGRSL